MLTFVFTTHHQPLTLYWLSKCSKPRFIFLICAIAVFLVLDIVEKAEKKKDSKQTRIKIDYSLIYYNLQIFSKLPTDNKCSSSSDAFQ